jgi:3-deoxy-D-manno-octulosonic-acid transferase
MRGVLNLVSHFFVQNKASENLLASIGITDVTVSGDTRFDRVTEILQRDNTLDFMERFKGDERCFVAGSTWKEDEQFLVDYINNYQGGVRFVIAPHAIHEDHIAALRHSITKSTILFSGIGTGPSMDYEVLVIDTIGLLTKIYSYADVAYVGGGFATGLHNTLEPAVFAIPVIIGPRYKGFREAEDLVRLQGIISVKDGMEFERAASDFLEHPAKARQAGEINASYIRDNKGASIQIIDQLRTLL